MADNKSIKFPTHHYVGFQARPSVDELPLGFMTPDGTDSAAVKRKATVDNWAASSGYYGTNVAKDKLPAQTYENKPMVGFKMGRNVRHGYGWGQGNVKWRIEDPRGFQLEITSPNLAQIMAFCTLEKGEILEECIWARLGSDNILVPVSSDLYEASVRNTERMAKKASLRDLKIGDSVVLQNGDEGIYYGSFYVISRTSTYSNESSQISNSGKKRHIFLMSQPGEESGSAHRFFKAVGSPKLAEVYSGEKELTVAEAEAEINRMMGEGVSMNEHTTNYRQRPLGVSAELIEQSNFTQIREDLNLDEIIQKAKEAAKISGYNFSPYYLQDNGITLMDHTDGETYFVSPRHILEQRSRAPSGSNHYPNFNSSHWEVQFTQVDKAHLEQHGAYKGITRKVASGYWSYRQEEFVTIKFPDPHQIPEDYYKFKMVGKTTNGCELSFYL